MSWRGIESGQAVYVAGGDAFRSAELREIAVAGGLPVEAVELAGLDGIADDAIVLIAADADFLVAGAMPGEGQQWIVTVPRDLLDAVAPLVGAHSIQLLCDPDPADVIAALAVARRATGALADADIGRDAMRLQQIADEVTRIAAALAEAGTHPRRFAGGATTSALPEIAVDDVRAILRLRRKRDALFGAGVFADPAWDMLLDLTAARLESVEIPVSSLCLAAAVPATTALRWMRTLFDLGLIERRADPDDKRRIHIVLTEPAYAAMRELLGEAKRAGLAAL